MKAILIALTTVLVQPIFAQSNPTEKQQPATKTVRRVTGIGGIFFKSKNPKALAQWYRDHLGMNVEKWGGVAFRWADDPSEGKGTTVWGPFKDTTKYFEPSSAQFMINFRVADLKGLLAVLRTEGCQVLDKVEESEDGKFGYVIDPDGNKLELWEPPHGR
jgi:catechol 2,3-dioxygenase-like lactoylglutathione lyase family enzyme